MRQFSRKITYILAVLTVVSAVCGCSGGNSPAPVVTESAPASVSESTAKASETEESVTSADTVGQRNDGGAGTADRGTGKHSRHRRSG